MKNKLLLQLHALLVFAAGALLAYFIQTVKARSDIDFLWNRRLLYLVLACGLGVLTLWNLLGYLCSRFRRLDGEKALQGDAYSCVAFAALLAYYPHFEHDFNPR